jgi:hypothetical protein
MSFRSLTPQRKGATRQPMQSAVLTGTYYPEGCRRFRNADLSEIEATSPHASNQFGGAEVQMTPSKSQMIAAILAFLRWPLGQTPPAGSGQERPGVRSFGRVTETRWPASPDWLHSAARMGCELSSISALSAEKWRTEKPQVESLGMK